MAPGTTESIAFCCSENDVRAYRALSGDDNPLHVDDGFARARGFERSVVYGGLIVAQISRLLGTRMPGAGCIWRSLALRFRNPLYAGDRAVVRGTVTHANEDLGILTLDIRVEAYGKKIAEGEAAAQLVSRRARVDA